VSGVPGGQFVCGLQTWQWCERAGDVHGTWSQDQHTSWAADTATQTSSDDAACYPASCNISSIIISLIVRTCLLCLTWSRTLTTRLLSGLWETNIVFCTIFCLIVKLNLSTICGNIVMHLLWLKNNRTPGKLQFRYPITLQRLLLTRHACSPGTVQYIHCVTDCKVRSVSLFNKQQQYSTIQSSPSSLPS